MLANKTASSDDHGREGKSGLYSKSSPWRQGFAKDEVTGEDAKQDRGSKAILQIPHRTDGEDLPFRFGSDHGYIEQFCTGSIDATDPRGTADNYIAGCVAARAPERSSVPRFDHAARLGPRRSGT